MSYAKTYEGMLYAAPSDEPAAIAFLSEAGYDTDYFDRHAYASLVDSLKTYPGINGIVLDGAISRIDRPEYLADELTYWFNTTIEEAKVLMERVPSHKHSMNLLDKQIAMIDFRLGELRKARPDATIVYSARDDDLQYTVSNIINKLMLAHIQDIGTKLEQVAVGISKSKQICRDAKRELRTLENGSGKSIRDRRYKVSRKLEKYEAHIQELYTEKERLKTEQQYFRESKERPLHQVMTRTFIEDLFDKLRAMCEKHGVVLITEACLLRFGQLTFMYDHSGHKTWGVVKGHAKNMRDGTQRVMRTFFDEEEMMPANARGHEKAQNLLDALRKGRVDAIVNSGHPGRPFWSVQKCATLIREINFKNAGLYDGEVSNRYVHVLSVMAFESDRKIGEFIRGGKQVRLSAGKPGGSRNSRAVDRNHAGAARGLTILTKGASGNVGTHWISYKHFETERKANESRIRAIPHVIAASSDEHIGGIFSLPSLLNGWVDKVGQDAREKFPFLTQHSRIAGVILPGDQVDANTDGWAFARDMQSRDPQEVFAEIVQKLVRMKQDDPEQIRQLAVHVANIAGAGTTESTDDIMHIATNYMWSLLHAVLPHTSLQHVMVRIPGNHSGGALKRLGMNSNAFFRQRMEAVGIPYDRVGTPDYINPEAPKKARVFLGGYGISLVGGVENYGTAVDGSALFGPVSLYVNHNPKGPELTGLANAGASANADVVIAGHTHEMYVLPYVTGAGDVGFAVRVPTLEGVTDVELYYSGSQNRVQGAMYIAMPCPGQLAAEYIPPHKLRAEGQRVQREIVKKAIDDTLDEDLTEED